MSSLTRSARASSSRVCAAVAVLCALSSRRARATSARSIWAPSLNNRNSWSSFIDSASSRRIRWTSSRASILARSVLSLPMSRNSSFIASKASLDLFTLASACRSNNVRSASRFLSRSAILSFNAAISTFFSSTKASCFREASTKASPFFSIKAHARSWRHNASECNLRALSSIAARLSRNLCNRAPCSRVCSCSRSASFCESTSVHLASHQSLEMSFCSFVQLSLPSWSKLASSDVRLENACATSCFAAIISPRMFAASFWPSGSSGAAASFMEAFSTASMATSKARSSDPACSRTPGSLAPPPTVRHVFDAGSRVMACVSDRVSKGAGFSSSCCTSSALRKTRRASLVGLRRCGSSNALPLFASSPRMCSRGSRSFDAALGASPLLVFSSGDAGWVADRSKPPVRQSPRAGGAMALLGLPRATF
mmetsp:Transcript_8831/g.25237  ORF Transcript_8831/g.25237 Transcript_8831/m.25237 type:complete len:426 (+) Transcript_8831:2109-3386(+)